MLKKRTIAKIKNEGSKLSIEEYMLTPEKTEKTTIQKEPTCHTIEE
jgi:hypothetical protein